MFFVRTQMSHSHVCMICDHFKLPFNSTLCVCPNARGTHRDTRLMLPRTLSSKVRPQPAPAPAPAPSLNKKVSKYRRTWATLLSSSPKYVACKLLGGKWRSCTTAGRRCEQEREHVEGNNSGRSESGNTTVATLCCDWMAAPQTPNKASCCVIRLEECSP